jgi:hypothetical protein
MRPPMNLPPLITALQAENEVITIALGGSRSRGHTASGADYDLFATIKDEAFETWRNELPQRAPFWDPDVIFASFDIYKPGWGYLYGVLTKHNYFDIAIVPLARMEDLGILSTNIIIKDSCDGILAAAIQKSDGSQHDPGKFYITNREAIEGRFLIDCYRFSRAVIIKNKLLMIRYLHFLRNSLLLKYRCESKEFGTIHSIPEKGFISESFAIELLENYKIDSNNLTLIKTYDWLVGAFLQYCNDASKVRTRLNMMHVYPLSN